jgi:hypothetical protein
MKEDQRQSTTDCADWTGSDRIVPSEGNLISLVECSPWLRVRAGAIGSDPLSSVQSVFSPLFFMSFVSCMSFLFRFLETVRTPRSRRLTVRGIAPTARVPAIAG